MFILIPTPDSQQNIKSLAMTTTMEASVLSNLNCKAAAKKKKSVFLSPLVLTRVTHIIPVCLEVEDQRSLRKWTNCFTISTVRKLSD